MRTGADGASPFFGSPRLVTPARTSSAQGLDSPLDQIKQALIHNRNELVLLFSRRAPQRFRLP
jgi:hypothetical protein